MSARESLTKFKEGLNELFDQGALSHQIITLVHTEFAKVKEQRKLETKKRNAEKIAQTKVKESAEQVPVIQPEDVPAVS